MIQRLENSGLYKRLSNKAYTYSAWVKSNSANASIQVWVEDWVGFHASHSGGGEWEYLTATYTFGDVSTLSTIHCQVGLDGYDSVNVDINSGDYLEVKDVQLELGSVATDFEHRSYGEELQLCKRYCQELCGGSSNQPIGNFSYHNSVGAYGSILLPVEMRITPTITIPDGTLFILYATSTDPVTTNLIGGAASRKRIELYATTAGGTVGHSAFLRTGSAAASILLTADP